MRRLYGEMDSPTLYREMRSTAEKSSNNFQSSKEDGRKTKKETKVSVFGAKIQTYKNKRN